MTVKLPSSHQNTGASPTGKRVFCAMKANAAKTDAVWQWCGVARETTTDEQ